MIEMYKILADKYDVNITPKVLRVYGVGNRSQINMDDNIVL